MTKLINAGLDNHTTTPTNLEISSIYCERNASFVVALLLRHVMI